MYHGYVYSLILIITFLAASFSPPLHADSFSINTMADSSDSNPGDGFNDNDAGDADEGANHHQNHPDFTDVQYDANSNTVTAEYSAPDDSFTVVAKQKRSGASNRDSETDRLQ